MLLDGSWVTDLILDCLLLFIEVCRLMVHLSHLVNYPEEVDVCRLLKEFSEVCVIRQQLLVLLLDHTDGVRRVSKAPLREFQN